MTYTIKKGDTLGALAKAYKTSVAELAKRNGIKNVNRIFAGATLEIPESGNAQQSQASNSEVNWGASANYGASFANGDATLALSRQLAGSGTSIPEYKSAYSEKIDALLDKIENKKDFSYDYSEDPLYESYKDSYTQGGKLAMADSMGSAAALTGGYGSSYAQNVGQQSYQAYLRALSDKVPELAKDAYDKYKNEEDALFSQLAAYGELEQKDYARYRDEVEDAADQRDFLYAQYKNAQEDALERYKAELEARRYEQELAYKKEQDALDQKNWELEYARKQSASSGKSGSASSSSKTASSSGDDAGSGEEIYSLFATMTQRERRVMLEDEQSLSYIRSVLGESGLAALRKKYSAK